MVPAEGMAAHFLLMLGGDIDEGIGNGEVVLLGGVADFVALHGAGRYEQVEVLGVELLVGGVGEEVTFADGGRAEGEVTAIGELAEGRWHGEWV